MTVTARLKRLSAAATRRQYRLWIVACIGLYLIACARLPDYARPVALDSGTLQKQDVIGYRRLQRADFKGLQPPPGFDHRMGAAICAYLENNIEAESFEFRYLGTANSSHVYEVTVNSPRIRAFMDRDCSWWNPELADSASDYVLEHEGVHFAIFEIAARKWSRDLETAVFRIAGSDESELQRDMQKQFDNFWEGRKSELDARNLEFDEQTSAVFDPERQKKWLATVRSELADGDTAENFDPASSCATDALTRQALQRARQALADAGYRPSLIDLVEAAEAAARPPECDPVRARILADKAYEISTQ
ncbi:MAG TPA: hypothetical protein VKB27_08380 [Gammaproteobacteria bacterium]|nr:hypothetical protein [Gammaproteobacteria bacterium]